MRVHITFADTKISCIAHPVLYGNGDIPTATATSGNCAAIYRLRGTSHQPTEPSSGGGITLILSQPENQATEEPISGVHSLVHRLS